MISEATIPNDKAICKTIRDMVNDLQGAAQREYNKSCEQNNDKMSKYFEGKRDSLNHARLEIEEIIQKGPWMVDETPVVDVEELDAAALEMAFIDGYNYPKEVIDYGSDPRVINGINRVLKLLKWKAKAHRNSLTPTQGKED